MKAGLRQHWHEIYAPDGSPRAEYAAIEPLLRGFPSTERRTLNERMDATLREMGVTFDVIRNAPWGQTPWKCDLLPQIFSPTDWELITRGIRQRLQAFELFLRDIYTRRQILRDNVIPVHPVLGSPYYQNASVGLPLPCDSYLHLCGIHLTRDQDGQWLVKQHHFGHASGISYMMQNRRALARVMPEIFQDLPVQSLAEMPLAIMESLRSLAGQLSAKPRVVLLSPGSAQAAHTKHSFLARRMGIPLVQGGDLLVLNDCVYLKTVQGLERVEVIYNRLPDRWLDPLVFRKDSMMGVPGLVHCVRKGTVKLINAIGAQLTDDRSLLAFSQRIIRYYLQEDPILRTVPTRWLGDLDQREYVLEHRDAFRIRSIFGDETPEMGPLRSRLSSEEFEQTVRRQGNLFVAQPDGFDAKSICFERGRATDCRQDHVIFALRNGRDFDIFPGALTRTFTGNHPSFAGSSEWASKDSWVLSPAEEVPRLPLPPRRWDETDFTTRRVTSRVAEAFYWLGRYLERAYHQAYLIQVVETLETEELNSAERKLYRPMWNRLLPPLDNADGSRRSISNRADRYRLLLSPEPGSVARGIGRGVENAETVQECLSPEALATLNNLRSLFASTRYRAAAPENVCLRATGRLSEAATQLIPQFFAVAANTMLLDDGWRFCVIGSMLERAINTANAVTAISSSFTSAIGGRADHATEIKLSAFLRLLGTRDAYRRIYQMRAEPIPVLEILWQNPQAPRSVLRCLTKCAALLRESMAEEERRTVPGLDAIDELLRVLHRIDWTAFISPLSEEPSPLRRDQDSAASLVAFFSKLLSNTLEVHSLITDGFLSHQARIAQLAQPLLKGSKDGV